MTGGFGLLVPHIRGLMECGDFIGARVLADAVLLALSVPAGLLLVARRGRMLPAVLAGSLLFNLAVGQDPLGAGLNWNVRLIQLRTIEPGAESEGCCAIDDHAYVTRRHDGRYCAVGPAIEAACGPSPR